MPDDVPISLDDLASALLRLPPVLREYLGWTLLDSTMGEEAAGAIDEEAHRRATEMARGEVAGVDADEVIASLRARHDARVEKAWAEEAHRRWEAYQRGEENMADFDDVMAQVRTSFRR